MFGNAMATKRLMAISLLLSIVGFLCVLTATFGPAWIVLDSGHYKWRLKEGIWLAQLCDLIENECKTSTREYILAEIGLDETLSQLPERHWVEFQICTILSLIGSFMTVVIATITVVRKSKRPINSPVLVVGFIACLSSCCFLLVPVLKISSVSTELFDERAWSIWVSSVGVLLQFVTSCLLVFTVYQNCRQSFKAKKQRALRRERCDIIMRYLGSQHGTNGESTGSQQGTSNRSSQSQHGTSYRSNQSQHNTSNRTNQSQYGNSNSSSQSQHGTCTKSSQSESRNREDSLAWTPLNIPHSCTNSVRSSVGIPSNIQTHLPAYNEIQMY